ncbi:MAG: hypothetical protein JNL04_21065 [Rhodospirillaceae bacterium]|nr:hypothetical protein [Rhodospirillaceae bacterium]
MTKKDADAAIDQMAVATVFSGPMAQAVAAGEACAKACIEMQDEMVRFTKARLQADVDAQKAFAACGTIAEVADAQRTWFTAASRDYLEEAGKLIQMVGRLTQHNLARWQIPADGKPWE